MGRAAHRGTKIALSICLLRQRAAVHYYSGEVLAPIGGETLPG